MLAELASLVRNGFSCKNARCIATWQTKVQCGDNCRNAKDHPEWHGRFLPQLWHAACFWVKSKHELAQCQNGRQGKGLAMWCGAAAAVAAERCWCGNASASARAAALAARCSGVMSVLKREGRSYTKICGRRALCVACSTLLYVASCMPWLYRTSAAAVSHATLEGHR
jgi:hypothetical protein